MGIPIEILAIIFLFLIWVSWMIWHKLSLKKLRRRYDPDGNLSRKGQEDRGTGNESLNTTGSSKPKGRGSVQKRVATSNEKDSRSIRKHFNPFRRRRN